MDKNAIKKYAVWARRELISRVSQRAAIYGITDDGYEDTNAQNINGKILTSTEIKQRQALITEIRAKGYEQVMEEVAYTWFNRFIALRFMEVNGYLPSHVRVFTDDENNFKPQILTEAINLEFEGLDMEKVFELKNANDNDELFKYLIIVQCNDLNAVLPDMFQKLEDYTELLFPDNILRDGSVIEQMITEIAEEDWTDQIQIIGWLYQYYNAEKKDEVFAALKKNVKITKENIPAATQLFTPDWIVRYMVENSLGRLWVEGHPDEEIKANWKYYLEEAEQEPDVEEQLKEIREEYAKLKPEDIKCIDPCCGSGHILAYMFDVLMQIYAKAGYTTRDAAKSIVENNIYGIDIDDRAAQLAYFSVMMKACQYDKRFLCRGAKPNVHAIVESNGLEYIPESMGQIAINDGSEAIDTINYLIRVFRDAKEYGSILKVEERNYDKVLEFIDEINATGADDLIMQGHINSISAYIPALVKQAKMLSQKNEVVVTNPPYMGSGGMSQKLSEFAKKKYPDSKSDLFAVFIERCGMMLEKNGCQAMITQHAWMFLSSFEKLRLKLQAMDIINMAHLGARAFEEIGGEVVQTTSFVIRKSRFNNYQGTYCRLIEPTTQQGKEDMFFKLENRYFANQESFLKIPGNPVAYWVTDAMNKVFKNSKQLNYYLSPKQGTSTGDNNLFLRLWFEVQIKSISFNHRYNNKEFLHRWYPATKGGEYRKWYGNNEYVIDWQYNGKRIANCKSSAIRNREANFREALTWTGISSNNLGIRYCPEGFVFTISGKGIIGSNCLIYALGFLGSKVANSILQITSPTMSFEVGYISALPLVYDENKKHKIASIVRECIDISRNDWDSFEISWDFAHHPLIHVIAKNRSMFDDVSNIDMAECYICWENECNERFNQLKANEEELNRIFIDIYGLQDELTPDVEDKDITVQKADIERDVKSFISYAVGCMLGRYSLDVEGLAFAGGEWNSNKYVTFKADEDNVIPICDDEYFEDDIVGRFVDVVRSVYGKNSLENNLQFIADALGGNGTPREVIRKYFMNDFYKDHCKIYQKRPIYWLFDSGRKGGFKALIYMHRYQPDTIARIRTDYVHEQQSRYRTAIADVENRMQDASTSARVKLNKKLRKLNEQAEEIRLYEEKIHHLADQMISIDLDDGVKHNYAIFQDVLAKIK